MLPRQGIFILDKEGVMTQLLYRPEIYRQPDEQEWEWDQEKETPPIRSQGKVSERHCRTPDSH